jgi:hypothetical protein
MMGARPAATTAAADIVEAAEAAGWKFWYAVILGDSDEWHRKRPGGKRNPNDASLGPIISQHWGDICRQLAERRHGVLLADFTPDERHRLWLLQLRWSTPQDTEDACMVADWIQDNLDIDQNGRRPN